MAVVNWSLQHFSDTAANMTANNPVLLEGQIGIETDGLTTTPKFKIGDGSTAWNTLPYANGTGIFQPLATNLTSWAGVTRAAGFDTFVATPSSANLASLVTDETGSGALVFGTQPTFTQWITTPRIYGGTGATDGIDFYSTSGNGTSGSVAHRFLGGNNGATTILTMLNNGTIIIPNNRNIQGVDSGGTNRNILTWSSSDNITLTGRQGVTDINLNPTSGGIGLIVKSNGDVGIGSASPPVRLHIIKTTEQLRVGYDTNNYLSTMVSSVGSLTLGLTGTTPEMYFNNTGGVIIGNKAALATSATDGFLYVPSCAGIPTGVPTAKTGKIAVVCDSTNNKMYIYSGGAWVALN